MTIDDRYVLDVTDLQRLRIACSTCKAELMLPRNGRQKFDFREIRVPLRCPGCNAEWMIPNSPQARALDGLIHAIGTLTAEAGNQPTFHVRFEIPKSTSH